MDYEQMKMEGFFSEVCPNSIPELEEPKRILDELHKKYHEIFDGCQAALLERPTSIKNFSELFGLIAQERIYASGECQFVIDALFIPIRAMERRIQELERRLDGRP